MKRQTFLRKFISLTSFVFLPSLLRSQENNMSKDNFSNELENAKSLKELSQVLTKLREAEKNLAIDGTWSIGTVFSHCAQSIQYSINGYPDMKSTLFRSTIGSAAFAVFSLRGKMRHGLEEPIPGSEKLDLQIPFSTGHKELLEAIAYFETKKSEDLKPHFAYGNLNKEEYDQAHALHIKNHFERITFI